MVLYLQQSPELRQTGQEFLSVNGRLSRWNEQIADVYMCSYEDSQLLPGIVLEKKLALMGIKISQEEVHYCRVRNQSLS